MTLMTPSTVPPLAFHLPRIDIRNLGPRCRDEDFVSDFVAQQFAANQIGEVSRVDLLPGTNEQGYLYYQALVHFARWHTTPQSICLRNAACSKHRKATIPLVGSQFYWIVNESHSTCLEEDWESLLTVVPGSKWTQAGDEAELVEYLGGEEEDETSTIDTTGASVIDCPEVCHLFVAQAEVEYQLALEALAQAERELEAAVNRLA